MHAGSPRGVLHGLGDAGGGGEVDVGFGAESGAVCALGGTAIDRDDAVAHGFGILDAQRAHASARPVDCNPLAGDGAANLQRLVDRHPAAHDGRDDAVLQPLRQERHVPRRYERVLGKRAVDGASRVRLRETARLARWMDAHSARAAVVADPADADALAKLDGGEGGRDGGAEGDDAADAFVAEDGAAGAKFAGCEGEVRAADAAGGELDEEILGAREGERVLFEGE